MIALQFKLLMESAPQSESRRTSYSCKPVHTHNHNSSIRAYADYQAAWAAGDRTFHQTRDQHQKSDAPNGKRQCCKRVKKPFSGDDGRPDWVARKTCNYLTGSIEVRRVWYFNQYFYSSAICHRLPNASSLSGLRKQAGGVWMCQPGGGP